MEKSQKYNRKGKKWNELTNADTFDIGKKKAHNCLQQNKFMEIFNKAQAYSLNIIYSLH